MFTAAILPSSFATRLKEEHKNCGAKLIMRLKKGDVIAHRDDQNKLHYWRVFRLQASNGYIGIGPTHLAGQQDKTPLIYKSAQSLKAMGAFKCRQTSLGFESPLAHR